MSAGRPVLLGERFGSLVTLEASPRTAVKILCRCDCGEEKRVLGTSLRSGNSTTCGKCWREGEGNGRFRHGMAGTPVYEVWSEMIARCTRPTHRRYADYGGRGITVCERWRAFENFQADMGPRPDGMSLDRIDNEKGYEPGNCQWADASTQARNRRPSAYAGSVRDTETGRFLPGVAA